MKPRKTWREKLERQQEPKVVAIPPKMQARLGTGTLLIPRPLDVDAIIRTVPSGSLMTISQLRAILADHSGASTTCPLVTGIFVRLAAETSAEDERAGRKRVSPCWRVIRDDGTLLEKYPGGAVEQAHRLAAEGHRIESRGKKLRVVTV